MILASCFCVSKILTDIIPDIVAPLLALAAIPQVPIPKPNSQLPTPNSLLFASSYITLMLKIVLDINDVLS